jgi:crotonobetainyl-CoA:carnitine CoA-transferase CaiB-like acyl-CoA transferase
MVDVSMLDSQVALLENAMARFLNTGVVPRRIGSRHPLVTPFQAFQTADEALVVCCDTEPQWQAMCRVIGRADLIAEERFGHNNTRTANHAALEPILAAEFVKRGRDDWLALLQAADVPCGPVNTIADIAGDPQIAARGMIAEVGGGRYARQPIRGASTAGTVERPAPALGEHTREILAGLGYPAAQIDDMAARHVI